MVPLYACAPKCAYCKRGSVFIIEFHDILFDNLIALSNVSNCDVELYEMLFGIDNFFLTDPAEVITESVTLISIRDYFQTEVLPRPTGQLPHVM